jgi:hypothetical protein
VWEHKGPRGLVNFPPTAFEPVGGRGELITAPGFSMTAHVLHLEHIAPVPTSLSFDLHQFAYRPNSPVHAEVNGDGEWDSPGFAYEDYARCHTETKKQSGCRRLDTPPWALDPTKLRAVITRYFELRAFGCHVRKYPIVGTEKERLARAQEKMLADKPKKLAVLDGLCVQYVALKRDGADPAQVCKLGQLIEGLDTTICLIDRGPSVFAAMVYYYYSLRMDSVGTAEALGLKPPAVRQTLFRMATVWKELNGPRVYNHNRSVKRAASNS